MIPRIIHYCWFGNTPLPRSAKRCIKSWKNNCIGFSIKRWDETNVDFYHNDFLREAYNAKAWAFVSDYVRLQVVYEYGGIYFDTDVELLSSLDDFLKYDSFFSLDQANLQCSTGLGFGGIKHSKMIKHMLDEYESVSFDRENKFGILCPIMNTRAMLKMGFDQIDDVQIIDNCIVLPPKYMDPIAPGNSRDLLCPDTVSIHHYNASWMPRSRQVKRKVVNFFGQRNVNYLKQLYKKFVTDKI